jgi:tetratricopeptide (TPR) repeat protein
MKWTPIGSLVIGLSSLASGGEIDSAPLDSEAETAATSGHAALDPYDEQFVAGNFVEAVDTAKLQVGELIARNSDELDIAAALTRLAEAQRLSGDLQAATQNYRDAISRIQTAEDMLAEGLVKPLVGLAQSLLSAGAYAPAKSEFERAAHITRVNSGPLNIEQCAILSELVDLHAEQGEYKKAGNIQDHKLLLYRRALGETDPKVINAWRRSGELLGLDGEHHDAQELYVFAADIIRVADGQYSLGQIPLLNDLSESYLAHAKTDQFTRIEKARAELEKIIIITENNADATPQRRAEAYLRMGDFMQRYGEWNSALYNYRLAWGQLTEYEEQRQAMFGEPVVLNPQSETEDPTSETSTIVGVSVTFDVSHRGAVREASVQDNPPTEIAGKRALSLARKLIFRPRIEDGDPVDTVDVSRTVHVDGEDRF